jgi:hypothetical protein
MKAYQPSSELTKTNTDDTPVSTEETHVLDVIAFLDQN